MIPKMRVVAIFCVLTLGAALGTQMHEQVQAHDASLRYRSEPAEAYIQKIFTACQQTPNPDRCALASGITI